MIDNLLILNKICIENIVLSQFNKNKYILYIYIYIYIYIIYILRMEVTLKVITI